MIPPPQRDTSYGRHFSLPSISHPNFVGRVGTVFGPRIIPLIPSLTGEILKRTLEPGPSHFYRLSDNNWTSRWSTGSGETEVDYRTTDTPSSSDSSTSVSVKGGTRSKRLTEGTNGPTNRFSVQPESYGSKNGGT